MTLCDNLVISETSLVSSLKQYSELEVPGHRSMTCQALCLFASTLTTAERWFVFILSTMRENTINSPTTAIGYAAGRPQSLTVTSRAVKFVLLCVSCSILVGCGIGCPPDSCEPSREAMKQLRPLTQLISSNTGAKSQAPMDLLKALGAESSLILPGGATLSRASSTAGAGYFLALPDTRRVIQVTYFVTEKYPDLSFEYFNRWGRNTCVWDVEKSDWFCFKR